MKRVLANAAIVGRYPVNIKAHPFEHLLSLLSTTVQFAFLSEGTSSHICYQATAFAEGGALPHSAWRSCRFCQHAQGGAQIRTGELVLSADHAACDCSTSVPSGFSPAFQRNFANKQLKLFQGLSTGTGCPGRLRRLLLWRYSRPAWTRSCGACCRWPCFGRRVGLGDPQRSLPTLNILWFCDSFMCRMPSCLWR